MGKFKKLIIATAICIASTSPVSAGSGGVAGSTEVTQLLNNLELLGLNTTAAQQAYQQLQQMIAQYESLALDIKNIEKLGEYVINKPDLSSMNGLLGALFNLHGDLKDAATANKKILADVSLSGLNPDQYLAKITGDRASAMSKNTQALVGEFQNALVDTQNAYTRVQEYEAKIPGIIGEVQSLQLLNQQMNTMIVQQARLMQNNAAFLSDNAVKSTAKQSDGINQIKATAEFIKRNREAMQAIKSAM